ncbi:MAG TPA: BON domain-containing protein [Pyrinomonadaceae bacterium]
MAYDEEHVKKSRVVVETPSERREVVESQVHTPDRSGISAGMVGVLVVVAIALITILVLFWMSSQPTTDPNANLTAQQQPPTTVIQQPAQQPPVIIQQPAPVVTQPAPVIISPGGGQVAPGSEDANAQAAVDKRIADDPAFSSLGITATVMNGKLTLIGSVSSETLKNQLEKTLGRIRGVKEVDNQLTVVVP